MHKNNNGSSLIMTICFTGAVGLIVLGVWRSSLYNLESCLARTIYMQSFKSTEGLLNLGVEIGVENFDTLMKRSQELSIEIPAWFALHNKSYAGMLNFIAQKDCLSVRSVLQEKGNKHCSLACNISRDLDGGYTVWSWKIEERM